MLHLADEHGVAEMQIRRGRVEADLHDQGSTQGEPGPKVVQTDDVDAALGETGYLLLEVRGTEHYTAAFAYPCAQMAGGQPATRPAGNGRGAHGRGRSRRDGARLRLGAARPAGWSGLTCRWRVCRQAFEGLRVGYITDLHHSEFVGLDDIQRAVALVAAERPDLVLFGGDYVSYGDVRYADPCAEALAALQAPLGVFAVLGNHDDDRSVPDALRRRGIAVLRDASTAITKNGDTLTLAGIRFWTRDAADVARAIGSGRAPVLLAAHDPRRVVEASSLNVAGVIAGHTHGGQIVLPGLGALAARKFPVASGRFSRGAASCSSVAASGP